MAFDVNSLGGKLIDNQELKKLIENGGGGGSANPLEPYPLFPKATKTTEIFVYEELEYMGFLFNGLDLSGVNEDTVFKLTVGETTAYYPFSSHYKESMNFGGMWVFPTEGKIFFSTNEQLITAEVELDVMPYGFVETFVINATYVDSILTTDKSQSDFSDYCYKWGSKSRVALLIVGDSDFFSSEIISVGNGTAFVHRGESVAIDGSTNKLQIYMSGYKWVSDNALDWWEHTFEV